MDGLILYYFHNFTYHELTATFFLNLASRVQEECRLRPFGLPRSHYLRLAQIDIAEQQTIAQRCPHYLLTLLSLSVSQSFRYRTFL